MNEIVKKFLSAGDKFTPEMRLKQPGFTYQKQRKNANFKETGDSWDIYQNKLDKACFQNDMACGDFKDLTRRTASNKILCDKAFNFAKFKKQWI